MVKVKYTCPNSPLTGKASKDFNTEVQAKEWIKKFKEDYGNQYSAFLYFFYSSDDSSSESY